MLRKYNKLLKKAIMATLWPLSVFVVVAMIISEMIIVVEYFATDTLAYLLVLVVNVFLLVLVLNRWRHWHDSSIEKLETSLDELAKTSDIKALKLVKVNRESREVARHINKVVKAAKEQIDKLKSEIQAKEIAAKTQNAKQQEMQQGHQELQILRDIADRISYSLNIPAIVEVIAGSMSKVLPYTSIAYILLDKDLLSFHIRLEESVNRAYIDDIKEKMINSLVGLTGSEDIIKIQTDDIVTGSVVDDMQTSKLKSFFNGPLVINGKTVGLLNVASTVEDNFTERQMSFLFTITKKVSSAVEQLRKLLEEEKGKLSAMVASISDGLVMVDNKLQLMVVNPALKIMLDLAMPEVTIFDIMAKLHDVLDVRNHFQEAIKLDKLTKVDEFFLGQLYMRPIFSPVRDKTGNQIGAVMLLQDVTKERELQELREDFTSMMVHELRSPLDGINKMSELLAQDKINPNTKDYKKYIELIKDSSKNMLSLVNDLLDVSKLEAGKIQLNLGSTDILKLIEQRLQFYETSAKNGKINLSSLLDPKTPLELSCDQSRIIQVLNNLISNALKFTPAGGNVTIQTLVHKKGLDIDKESQSVGIKWFKLDKHEQLADSLLVAVTDSGPGMGPEVLPQLFSKFTQFKAGAISEKKGTGLGLAIVKGIIEAHGGQVWVASKLGQGSTFYFTLPLTILPVKE